MKRLFSLPIRQQLLLIILVIALPSIAIIAKLGIEQRKRAIADAYQLTQLIAERIASEQKYTAAAAEQLLVTLAQMPEVRQRNHAKVQPLLHKLNKLNPSYTNILVADLDGTVWAAVFTPPPSARVDDRRYFRNAVASGQLSSGEYVISKSMAKPVFHFAYPYRDGAGRISGVIIVAFGLDSYQAILKSNTFPDGTNFLLLDHQGVVLNRAVAPEKIVGRRYTEEALQEMFSGPDESSYRGHGAILQEERFVTYRKLRLPAENEPYMYVRVGVPVKSALADAHAALTKSIALFVSVLGSALLLSYLIGKRSIVDRIGLLQQAAHRLAHGDLQVRVADAVPYGELGSLAESFDAMAHQVSERDREIRQSEARLRSITDSAQDAILMMDAGGAISYWNPAAETILGYRAEEVMGQNLHLLLAPPRFHADYRQAFSDFARSGLGEVVGRTIELVALRKDGNEIPIALSLSAVLLDEGWHAIGILRDITELKQYQQELEEARHNADAANRAKSEFLANMSHEIRTPMNGVIGMAQLLRFTQPNREQEEYLNSLEASCKCLLELINDILDLSRIESGKLALEMADFSLRRSVQEVLDSQAGRISQKGLELAVEIEEQVPELVRGDALRFKQILLNLLGNAIKFTDSGSITVAVSIASWGTSCCALRLMVRDTGIGMNQAVQEKIFLPFEQADNSTTRKYGGSGLGLSICHRLCELMGGKIWVTSAPGQGTSFFVELPFSVRDNARGQEQLPLLATDVCLVALRPLKVLVAEDNKLNADSIVAMLRLMGHQAGVAENGRRALEMWHATAFHCILMDIQMPVMDGHLAMTTIREQESKMGGHTPIIALTAHALLGDRERFLAEGFDGYLAKPIEIKSLAHELARVVGGLESANKHL